MAIWQYSFLVIPNVVFEKGNLRQFLDEDGVFDDESCWLMEPIKTDFFNDIERILPKNRSWSDEIVLFGNEDSNRFEVYKDENENVVSVSFRIDYTSDYEEILRSLVDFVSMNGLGILNERLELISNNFTTVKSHIEHSEHHHIYEKLKTKHDE